MADKKLPYEELKKEMYEKGSLLQMTPDPDSIPWHCIDTDDALQIAKKYIEKERENIYKKLDEMKSVYETMDTGSALKVLRGMDKITND